MADSQFNSREIIVGTGVTSPSETTLATFKSTATAGEIGVFSKDGGTLAAGDDFVVAVKTSDNIIVSDVIKASTAKVQAKATVAEAQKVLEFSNITVPSTTGTTAEYILELKINGYAGSTSTLDYYHKFGHYVFTQTGSLTGETIVDGLISNLNKSFSKEPGATASTNPLFTFSKGYTTQTLDVTTTADTSGNVTVNINGVDIVVALTDTDADTVDATKIAAGIDGTTIGGTTASAAAVGTVVTVTLDDGSAISTFTLTDTGSTNIVVSIAGTSATASLVVTGKAQTAQLEPFKNGFPLSFEGTLKPDTGYTFNKVVVQSANPGTGTGKQVAYMEFFYRGARGDAYRGVGYPYSYPTSTKKLSAFGTAYDIIEIQHSVEGGEFNTVKLPKSLVIACPNNGTNDVADNVIGRLETVTGLTIADLS
jgi:hypothetical protein